MGPGPLSLLKVRESGCSEDKLRPCRGYARSLPEELKVYNFSQLEGEQLLKESQVAKSDPGAFWSLCALVLLLWPVYRGWGALFCVVVFSHKTTVTTNIYQELSISSAYMMCFYALSHLILTTALWGSQRLLTSFRWENYNLRKAWLLANFSNGESLDHRGRIKGASDLREVGLCNSFSRGNCLDESPRTR